MIFIAILAAIGGGFFILNDSDPSYVNKKHADVYYEGYQQNYAAKYDALLRIKVNGSVCSAFVISKDYALTAAHCLTDDISIITKKITIYNIQDNTSIEGHAASVDVRRDIGLIRADFSDFATLKVRYSKSLLQEWSNQFVGCGFPAGSIHYYCESADIQGLGMFSLKTSAPVFPGMSGGPVLDVVTKEVIGIITKASPTLEFATLIAFDAALGVENPEMFKE